LRKWPKCYAPVKLGVTRFAKLGRVLINSRCPLAPKTGVGPDIADVC